MDEIPQIILAYLVEHHLDGDSRGLDTTTDLIQAQLLDSFGSLRLVTYLNERFRVRIGPEQLTADNFRSVASLSSLVKRYQAMNVDG